MGHVQAVGNINPTLGGEHLPEACRAPANLGSFSRISRRSAPDSSSKRLISAIYQVSNRDVLSAISNSAPRCRRRLEIPLFIVRAEFIQEPRRRALGVGARCAPTSLTCPKKSDTSAAIRRDVLLGGKTDSGPNRLRFSLGLRKRIPLCHRA
jgi:hypothetical protein